jgi:hypothetical protein
MSLVRGLIEPGLSAVKKTAPFYSAVDEALAAIKRPKGTGAEFFTELTKQAGVKKAELADRKLEQAFKAKGKMTKEEAQQVLKDNPPPKLNERELVEIDDSTRERLLDEKLETSGYDYMGEVPARRLAAWNEEIDADMEKYGDYRSPGGQNYREILLKLPKSDTKNGDKNYWSTHFLQDPNVLAHMRVQDRKGLNGEKILHVEEIQSDWHQEGRKKGYKPDDYVQQSNAIDKEFDELLTKRTELQVQAVKAKYIGGGEGAQALTDEANSMTPKLMQLQEQRDKLRDVINYGVPDAPFKKNWHELAMKRLLNYAADNGYDSIAITPGAEQAKRYSLANHVDEISYYPRTNALTGEKSKSVRIDMKSGRPMQFGLTPEGIVDNVSNLEHTNLVGKNISDIVGKEHASNIMGAERGQISGGGLTVGGEGMVGFYDKMLPDYLNAFGKPYGAQVSTINMPNSRGIPPTEEIQRLAGINQDQWRAMTGDDRVRILNEITNKVKAEGMPLHSFPITPEMRESIKQKGLPLYQQIGIPTAGAGAASQMPEQEEPQYGPGGAITKMALKAAPAPKAPMIIKPSALTELQKIVQQEKGGYGLRRLERAADEIPNLEKMFKQDALTEAFTGDNAKALMTMNPADFEKYAVQLKFSNHRPKYASLEDRMRVGDIFQEDLPTDEYIKFLRTVPEGFNDVPFLQIDKQEYGLPLVPSISGHEGRHRSRALAESGENKSLVRLFPKAELREPLPRRSQEEYIEALKKELEMTGNIVTPEDYGTDKRPPIILPDIYAKGGAVKPKVKDTKSGKVRMTTNRDTMFMELSNKKLKRK